MAKKVKFELNREGVRQLMQSEEMQAILRKKGEEVKSRCGPLADEYSMNEGVGSTRAHVTIAPDTPHAYYSNLKHNTLLKAIK